MIFLTTFPNQILTEKLTSNCPWDFPTGFQNLEGSVCQLVKKGIHKHNLVYLLCWIACKTLSNKKRRLTFPRLCLMGNVISIGLSEMIEVHRNASTLLFSTIFPVSCYQSSFQLLFQTLHATEITKVSCQMSSHSFNNHLRSLVLHK